MSSPPLGMFMATIRGGPHDGHVHVFPLTTNGQMPAQVKVPDGWLKLQRLTDHRNLPIYVLEKFPWLNQ